MAFRGFGAELEVVPVDDDGLQVDELERRLALGLQPKLVYSIPDHQNPPASASRPSAARRSSTSPVAGASSCSRTSPTASSASPRNHARPCGRSHRTWSSRQGRRRRPSSPGCGSAGRQHRRRSPPASSPRSRTPTSARARSASGSSRSTSAAAGSTSSSRSRGRSTGASASACSPRSSVRCRTAPAGRRRRGGFFSWLTLPDGGDSGALARRATEAGLGIVPGSVFFPDGRGGDNVRLSFSLVDEPAIDDGIARLAELL